LYFLLKFHVNVEFLQGSTFSASEFYLFITSLTSYAHPLALSARPSAYKVEGANCDFDISKIFADLGFSYPIQDTRSHFLISCVSTTSLQASSLGTSSAMSMTNQTQS
jgi:hypothetical protein